MKKITKSYNETQPDSEVNRIETAIDDYILTHPILSSPREYAYWYVLLAHELIIYEDITYKSWGFVNQLNRSDQMKYALKYGLEWISKKSFQSSRFQTPKIINSSRLNSAKDLIRIGLDYQGIWNAFTCYRKGSAKAEIIEPNTIKFSWDSKELNYQALDNIDKLVRSDRFVPKFLKLYREDSKVRKAVDKISNVVRFVNKEYLDIDYSKIDVKLIKELLASADNEEDRVPSKWTYKGINIHKFREFWNTVSAICFICTKAHISELNSGNHRNGLGSYVIVKSLNEWIHLVFSHAKDLEIGLVQEIISILIYDPLGKTVDPALQPFIRLGNEHIALAPQLFLGCNNERNLLSLLSKIDADEYSKTTNLFENELILTYENALENREWPIASKKNIKGEKELPDVDLAIFDHKRRLMLIVELKCVIAPAEVSEVFAKSDREAEGISQIKRLLDYSSKNKKNSFSSCFPDFKYEDEFEIVGCVAIKGFVGSAANYESRVPVIESKFLLQLLLENSDLKEVVNLIQRREYLPVAGKDFEERSEKIEIGPYTIFWVAILPKYLLN